MTSKIGETGHDICSHRFYGLSCADFEQLLKRANGRCELCGIDVADVPHGKLCVDHDHQRGWSAVRGLVCPKCNSHLRYVDSGLRTPDDRTLAYFALSGHVPLPQPRKQRAPRPNHVVPRRRGDRRIVVAFKLSDDVSEPIDHRAIDEGLTIRGGDPNRSEMIRLMLAYAAQHMPKGWRPSG